MNIGTGISTVLLGDEATRIEPVAAVDIPVAYTDDRYKQITHHAVKAWRAFGWARQPTNAHVHELFGIRSSSARTLARRVTPLYIYADRPRARPRVHCTKIAHTCAYL